MCGIVIVSCVLSLTLVQPTVGSDSVCHNGDIDMNLDLACGRIRTFEGGAGAMRRQLNGMPTPYSCLPHYRVPVVGTNGKVMFAYHASLDIM